jgi:hypothetical protein
MICPNCKKENKDNWPLEKGPGGCQECWEIECDAGWWEAVVALDKLLHLEEE